MLPIGEAFFIFSSCSFAETLSFVTQLKAKLLDGFVFADISFILGCEFFFLIVISMLGLQIQAVFQSQIICIFWC